MVVKNKENKIRSVVDVLCLDIILNRRTNFFPRSVTLERLLAALLIKSKRWSCVLKLHTKSVEIEKDKE